MGAAMAPLLGLLFLLALPPLGLLLLGWELFRRLRRGRP